MPARKPTNSAIAKGISTTEPNAAGWAALDRLPRALRRLLWGAPTPINPQSVEAIVTDHGEAEAFDATRKAIGEEMWKANQQHREAHGYKLPGVAAEVPPLRYVDEAVLVASKPRGRLIFRRGRRR